MPEIRINRTTVAYADPFNPAERGVGDLTAEALERYINQYAPIARPLHWDQPATGLRPLTRERGDTPTVRSKGNGLPGICYFKEPVAALFDHKTYSKRKEDAVVGIEIEQETKDPFELPAVAGWSKHNEGSLRDFGFEYVLSPPQKIADSRKSVEELYSKLPVAQLSSSIRTSVHVHFDVTRYQFQDLATFACVYWLCEPILTEYAGANRKGNLFCLRAEESNYTQKVLAMALKEGEPRASRLYNEGTRYASLNWASIQKFGSFESRLMRGTADPVVVNFWVNAINELRLFALKFGNPHEFLTFFFDKKNPAEKFYDSVFSSETLKELKASIKSSEKDIVSSIRSVASSLFCILAARKDYNTEDEAKKLEEAHKKAVEDMAKQAAEYAAQQAIINSSLTRAVSLYPLDYTMDNVESVGINFEQHIIEGDE